MRSGLPGIVALHQYRADLIAAAGAGLRGQPQAAHRRGGAGDGDAAERVGQQPGHGLHVLGRVPIAGSTATVQGLRLTGENLAGRRNKIGTVLVERDGVTAP